MNEWERGRERERKTEKQRHRDSETETERKSFWERRKYYGKWLLFSETDSESQSLALCFTKSLALTGCLILVDSILLIRKMWTNMPQGYGIDWMINKCKMFEDLSGLAICSVLCSMSFSQKSKDVNLQTLRKWYLLIAVGGYTNWSMLID